MDENRLTFLTEVELPPYCFLSEAVEWIAFGRVPQMQYYHCDKTEQVVDYRFYWREMPDNFEPNYEFPWFDRLEFESLGIPIDEKYFRAADKCFGEDVHDLPTRIAQFEKRSSIISEEGDGSTVNVAQNIADEYRAKLEELGPLQEYVDVVEKQFQPFFDVACAKLFQLLALGEITCEALNNEYWEELFEADEYHESDYVKASQFKNVPAEAFTLGMDWSENKIVIAGVEHVALRLKTKDILDNRPQLLQSGNSITVERFGSFYFSAHTARSTQRSKLGRRELIDWRLLKDYLQGLSDENSVPEGKENCIYELIAYAERELGKSPSRTAVQRNMRLELDALFARK